MSDGGDPRLEGALRSLPARRPPAGWQERVLERLDERTPGRMPWLWALLAGLAVAAALLVYWRWPRPAAHVEIALMTELRRDGPDIDPFRATATVGDQWRLRVRAGDASWDLRVYRDGHMVASCATLGCSAPGLEETVTYALRQTGSYRALLLVGRDIPQPSHELASDLNLADQAGMKTRMSSPLEVLSVPPAR